MYYSESRATTLSIDEAREAIVQHLHTGKGTKCTVCHQNVKPYQLLVMSPTNRTVLRLLATAREGLTPNQLMTSCSSIRRRRNWTALRMLGLIVKEENVWKITKLGRRVFEGKLRVPKTIKVYNNTMMSKSEERARF